MLITLVVKELTQTCTAQEPVFCYQPEQTLTFP